MASKRPAFSENIHRLFDEAQADRPGARASSRSSSRARRTPRSARSRSRKILPNPAQPRLSYEEDSLTELADSIREHGVLQPILVRPGRLAVRADRRRAALARVAHGAARDDPGHRRRVRRRDRARGLDHREPPARGRLAARGGGDVPQDDRTSATRCGSWPRRSARTRATSRTACAWPTRPPEIRELVSVRKDTISHAYELMKIGDERTRRRLAKKVAPAS